MWSAWSYDTPVSISPETGVWQQTGEYYANKKVWVRRFTGTITQTANAINDVILVTNMSNFSLIYDYGGSWFLDSGVALHASHFFLSNISTGAIENSYLFRHYNKNLVFRNVSINDRTNAPYDIWVKITTSDDLIPS
jgi:hypothetical protein